MAKSQQLNEAPVNETTAPEQITIDKAQLDAIFAAQDEMRATIALLTKQAERNSKSIEATDKVKVEEERLLEIVRKANERGAEMVEMHIDKGSLKSNKNLELNINGVQTIIPKGQTVTIPRKAAAIIENSEKQQAKALGIQEVRAKEAEKAIEEKRI